MLRTSIDGRTLIERFEGFRGLAYKDSVGVWTIGYGHTSMAGTPHVFAGLTVSLPEADAILSADLQKTEAAVLKVLGPTFAAQHEFDACVSLAFNIGSGAFARSSIAAYMKAGHPSLAAAAFGKYVKAGGRTLPGLVTRRAAESVLFLTADVAAAKHIAAAIPDYTLAGGNADDAALIA